MRKLVKHIIREIAATIFGASMAMIAVAYFGKFGISASGMTSGLATLGYGKMIYGIAMAGIISIGSYSVFKSIVTLLSED